MTNNDDELDPNFDAFATLADVRRFLRDNKIQYTMHDSGEDDILISFATVGARFEVCIDKEVLFWSVFEGREFQQTNVEMLKALVIEANQ